MKHIYVLEEYDFEDNMKSSIAVTDSMDCIPSLFDRYYGKDHFIVKTTDIRDSSLEYEYSIMVNFNIGGGLKKYTPIKVLVRSFTLNEI